MSSEAEKHSHQLIQVSRELSGGKPLPQLFQKVIELICKSTGSDGGTLYMHDRKQNSLKAVLLTNYSLNINSVVEEFDPLSVSGFIEVPLYQKDVASAKISTSSFLERRIITVEDVNNNNQYDFAGVRDFDKKNNYKTERIIAFPLNANNIAVGVLQVINPNPECFQPSTLEFLESLASQIAIALNNAVLIKEGENLLGAIVQMIGMAIDEKSPHTAGHCYRVTELTMMLADAVSAKTSGVFADFKLSDIGRDELRMAALLHDVGKVVTPDHVLEKRTKLYMPTDRMEFLVERARLLKADAELKTLKEAIIAAGQEDLLQSIVNVNTDSLSLEDIDFLDKANKGLIVMTDENIERLNKISNHTIAPNPYSPQAQPENVIPRDDVSNLKTFRGTLNPEERKIMENHVKSTIRLLSSIPWPHRFSRLVEYAGHHHEKLNGTGYPNRISAESLSIPARILGIADRFEGMSAPDRPYRSKSMTLSRVLSIMQSMCKEGEIDPELYDVFIESKIYIIYGKKYLDATLVDCA